MALQHDLEFDDPIEFDKRLGEAHHLAKLGLWEFDLVTGISKWSAELYEIYGRDKLQGSFTREEFDAHLSPDEKEILRSHEKRAITLREAYTIEHSFSFPDGTVKYLIQKVKPIVDTNGTVVKLYGVTQDITDRKTAEIALEESRQLIASIKIEKALIEEKKKAEAIADIKHQFVSAMSHEIRTPMNGVIGMTNLLVETPLNAEQQEYVSLIRESADNLLVIINDILDFSKLSAGMMTMQRVEFDLPDLVSNVMKLLRHKAQEKKLKFSLSNDSEIPSSVFGDPTRLRQVLLNLLGNALKFTEYGEITLSADVLGWQPGKVVIKFEVKDTGIGIPKDKLDTIFENFIQVVENSTHHKAGTGLGLCIARQLVEAQGGNIHVASEVGFGSTFSFILAFDYLSEPKIQPKTEEQLHGERLNGLRILLAEDNPINQKVAKLTLEKMGAYVVIADNGSLALEKLAKATFNLIIMDIQMPVMNGFEATKLIRAMDGSVKDIPIIAMTASAMAGEKEECIAAGMNDFISKPFTKEDILTAINANLSPKQEKTAHTTSRNVQMVTIDLRYLRQLQDNDEFLAGIIEDFLQTAPGLMVELKQLFQNQEWRKVCELAHKAKQGYQILGIKEATIDWDLLEHASRESDMEELDKAVYRLEIMSNEAFKALQSILVSFK